MSATQRSARSMGPMPMPIMGPMLIPMPIIGPIIGPIGPVLDLSSELHIEKPRDTEAAKGHRCTCGLLIWATEHFAGFQTLSEPAGPACACEYDQVQLKPFTPTPIPLKSIWTLEVSQPLPVVSWMCACLLPGAVHRPRRSSKVRVDLWSSETVMQGRGAGCSAAGFCAGLRSEAKP